MNDIKSKFNDYIEKAGTAYIDWGLVFDASKEVTKEVDFVNDLRVSVILKPIREQRLNNGYCKTDKESKLVNGKLDKASIVIYGHFTQEKMVGPFFDVLYHELNHIYDTYMNLYNEGNTNRFTLQATKSAQEISSPNLTPFENTVLNGIIYHLFTDTEFNAWIAGAYGELANMNSERKNFKSDLEKTYIYKVYKTIRDNYEIIIDSISDKELMKYISILNGAKFHIMYMSDNPSKARKALKRKVAYQLQKMIWKIGRAASLYYENKEEEERNDKWKDGIIISDNKEEL